MLTLLITLDCVRADHVLGEKAETPNLDRFREEAVAFTRAYAHTNITLPSHVTMFTGRLLPEHGADFNFCSPKEEHFFLADRFRAMGMPAAGFVGIHFLSELYAKRLDQRDAFYKIPSSWLASGLLRRLGVRGYRRGAQKTLEAATDWLLDQPTRSGFCWIHLFDTHMDYQAGEPWRTRCGVTDVPSDRPLDEALEEKRLHSLHPVAGQRRPLDYYPKLYRASISQTDALLGDFFRRMRAEGLWEKALVIVTADHGENLLEHGAYCSHPLIFDETIRVPLLVKFPGGDHGGEEVGDPVGHQDILPTVLARYEKDPTPCRGVDLASFAGGSHPVEPRDMLAFHGKMLQGAVRRGGVTWIENLDHSRLDPKLADLYRDTGLFGSDGRHVEGPGLEAELHAVLQGFLQGVPSVERAEVPGDERIREQLRSLGYME